MGGLAAALPPVLGVSFSIAQYLSGTKLSFPCKAHVKLWPQRYKTGQKNRRGATLSWAQLGVINVWGLRKPVAGVGGWFMLQPFALGAPRV